MVKFIKQILIFLLFSMGLYILMVILWAHFAPFNFLKKNVPYPIGGKGYSLTRLKEATKTEDIDILFLGSSHAYRSFDPRVYQEKNMSAFNLGSPSQTPLQTMMLLRSFLDQLNPKLVIYEVYPATFQNDGLESSIDVLANGNNLEGSFSMVTDVNQIKGYNVFIYDTFREAFNLNKDVQQNSIDSDNYVSSGYVESAVLENESPITEEIKRNWKNNHWEMLEKQRSTFNEILKLFKEKNINFCLMQTPVTVPAFNLYDNNVEMDTLFGGLGPYYNLNYMMQLNDTTDFMDYHHLNKSGAQKTNDLILKLIMDQDLLEVKN